MAKPTTTTKTEDWDSAAGEPGDVGAATAPPRVKVKCIVHTLPHTGIADPGAAGLGMKHKEVREVPESVALAMVEAGQVVLV